MAKLLYKIALYGILALPALAEDLPECKSEKDTIAGCVIKKYYKNGNLLNEISYKNSLKEGISKAYYENGNLQREGTFKKGSLEGVTKFYTNKKSLFFGSEMLASITFENDKAISGKCDNGTTFNAAHLQRFSNGNMDIKEVAQICDVTLED